MASRLTRLRIAGFKSFAEPVSLDILPGLTGIVGPNGCGKSNVVEALRWAMGETSARSLRGGEMDDVIFAGTTARASRNLAEVTVTLDGAGGALPAPFEAEAELQVTRRIERGAGSAFRANGRELRARDVQTLYADLASGARSSGMVSQGRVAALVNARPEERRQVLEEAAGITGLHARRHEAELKLRAAEQNLARSEDLRTQLDGTREALRRQARQAARYRNISGLIRAAEAEHLGVLHGQARAGLERALADATRAEAQANAAALEQQVAAEALADAEAALPAPRQAEAEQRSLLERRRLEAETLAAEATRVREEADHAAARLRELEADLDAAERSRGDAAASVARLSAERDRLHARLADLPEELHQALTRAADARDRSAEAQCEADAAAAFAADAASATRLAAEAVRVAGERVAASRCRHAALSAELSACAATRIGEPALAAAGAKTQAAESALDRARSALEAAEADRAAASAHAAACRVTAERDRLVREAAEQALRLAETRAAQADATGCTARSSLDALLTQRIATAQIAQAQHDAETAEARLAEAEARIDACDQAVAAARLAAAEARGRAEQASSARGRAVAVGHAETALAARLAGEIAEAASERATIARAAPTPDAIEAAETGLGTAASDLVAVETAWQDAAAARAGAAGITQRAREAAAEAEAAAARLAAEAGGLRDALGDPSGEDAALAELHVPAGLEAAVGAALAEAATSLDPASPRHWRSLPSLPAPALPPGCIGLDTLVAPPPALARAMSHVALLEHGDGDALQAGLTAGQSVVDRAGACWRWDGHVARAGARNLAAARLVLRRRLREAEAGLAAVGTVSDAARLARDEAESAEGQAIAAMDEARAALLLAQDRVRDGARSLDGLKQDAARAAERLAALNQTLARLGGEHRAAEQAVFEADAELAALPPQSEFDTALSQADAAVRGAELAAEEARAWRTQARAEAQETRLAAQACAAGAARIEALIDAAEPTVAHAVAAQDLAVQALHHARSALETLPDPHESAAALHRAIQAEDTCRSAESHARDRRQAADSAFDAARQEDALLRAAHVQAETGFAALSGLLARSHAELVSEEAEEAAASELAAGLPDPDALAQAARTARQALEAARDAAMQEDARCSASRAEQAQAERDFASLEKDVDAWRRRLDEASLRETGLKARRQAAHEAWSALSSRPDELASRASRSGQSLAAAEAAHAAACGMLAAAEGRVRALSSAERDAGRQAGTCREQRSRAEAAREAGEGALKAVLARAADRLGEAMPIPEMTDVSDAAEERARKKCERLTRERDEMGPVNLRAELELDELETRIGAIEAERAELGTAIAKLRGAIGHLNREGRERLAAVFTEVDRHFRTLFTRMMGGGRAHLALTGSSDPLEAGLEIYAEPPGKKLSALSLLSGGEQALTALSLIFAVFRCTPAPVCVLDEVDAPLDDANVDRFCMLLDDVVRETGTSFLVVTHHQLTMSRMDRLYGVTMQERGVSRLLSVDLSRAAAMVMLQAAE